MAPSPAGNVSRFGLFELDLKAGQLRKNGMKIRLARQPIHILAMLLDRPGEFVTREEFKRRIWPSDVLIDFDHGLNKSIQRLREALGDSSDSPRFIETIPRIGYRFIGPLVGIDARTENGVPSDPSPAHAEVVEDRFADLSRIQPATENGSKLAGVASIPRDKPSAMSSGEHKRLLTFGATGVMAAILFALWFLRRRLPLPPSHGIPGSHTTASKN